jgi:transcriptional regulator with XRE-family HTH domain
MENKFKEFRKVNQISQEELAQFLGVTRSFISQVETGRSPLPFELRKLIQENHDWNSSMLEPEKPISNQQLLDLIASQQKTIEMQARTIELLEKRTASLDAQEDYPAGCAAANGQ